jgi:hypothetical protein
MILNDFLVLCCLMIISSSVIKESDGYDTQQVVAFQNVQLPQTNNINIPGSYTFDESTSKSWKTEGIIFKNNIWNLDAHRGVGNFA